MAAQQHGHQYQEIAKHSEMLTACPDDPHVIETLARLSITGLLCLFAFDKGA